MVKKMTTQYVDLDFNEADRQLDEKIRVLQNELNQLKRARRARRAKAQSRYLINKYLSTM